MESSPQIEIGIITVPELVFRLAGKFYEPKSKKALYNHCKAQLDDDGIRVETEAGDCCVGQEIVLLPSSLNADHFEISDVVIGVDFHWEQKETQSFKGALKLKRKGEKIIVVNVIPVEDYLHSVISSEMSADSSLELLKAHAIISRSWLMAQIRSRGTGEQGSKGAEEQGRRGETELGSMGEAELGGEYVKWFDRDDHEDFHVCADDHCQRYQGISRVKNTKVIAAVNETRGMVLKSGGEICDARYSKSCGGATELFENCWEEISHPYLQGFRDLDGLSEDGLKDLSMEENAAEFILTKPDAFCNTEDPVILSQVLNNYDQDTKDFYRWELCYTQKELSELIKKRSGINFGKIKALEPVERGSSGRLVKLRIIGTEKELVIGKELIIRRWLSESHLFSSAFVVGYEEVKDGIPGKFVLRGAGWGHGVGLCQIGAAVMGEKGYKYDEILKHYYRGATIERLYS